MKERRVMRMRGERRMWMKRRGRIVREKGRWTGNCRIH
jgi:hypothetical protein